MTFLSVEHQLENVLMDLCFWGCACWALPVPGCCCAVCAQLEHAARAGPLQGWLQPELWIWVNVWSGMSQLELLPPVPALIPSPTLAC